ncbi:MAG: hypothetical protein K2N35_14260, partial [Muribaculaceae bacterium]|nr:hypothetical protein [Muribaculaceae bacterium]
IGTDQAYVKVKTSTPGNRKLLIIKDSYGNAVPGNLFYSFNEVHVIDFRYFTHNLKEYVNKNGITDIAVCFNVFNAYSSGSASKVKKMLTQSGGIPAHTNSDYKPKEKKQEPATTNIEKDNKSVEEPSATSVNESSTQETENTKKEETPVTPETTEE